MGLVHFRYQISRHLHRFGRRDNGFTLTELAIAMVVLGVIASIAIPSYLGSRNNSYDKEAQSSIENVLKVQSFSIKVREIFLMHHLRSVVIRQHWQPTYRNLNRVLMLLLVLFLQPIRE